jgi:hypothetical protein
VNLKEGGRKKKREKNTQQVFISIDHFLTLKSWKELIASCVGFEAIVA